MIFTETACGAEKGRVKKSYKDFSHGWTRMHTDKHGKIVSHSAGEHVELQDICADHR
jgi:hypothetical protein